MVSLSFIKSSIYSLKVCYTLLMDSLILSNSSLDIAASLVRRLSGESGELGAGESLVGDLSYLGFY